MYRGTFIETITPDQVEDPFKPERDASCRFVFPADESEGMITLHLSGISILYREGNTYKPDQVVEPNGRSTDPGWELYLLKTKFAVWLPLQTGDVFDTLMKKKAGKATGGALRLTDYRKSAARRKR